MKIFLNNNNNFAQSKNNPGYDQLNKIQPCLTDLQKKCIAILKSQILTADKQIIPFKAISPLKQYGICVTELGIKS